MSSDLTIALDGMGGDHAPQSVIDGADIARIRYPDVSFVIFGDEARIKPLLAEKSALAERCEVIHTEQSVNDADKPAQVMRRGRQSSMGLAINAVKEGRAQVAVSGGNTGALMALALLTLRTMEGIDRPALASLIPTYRGESVMLDLGANVACSEDNLLEFALMGAAFARTVLGQKRPTVGLLNVGVEELKGNETIKRAGQRLRDGDPPFNFSGFVEGDDIGEGTLDVIVTDGFTGNVALKMAEGTVKLIGKLLRQAFESSLSARIGYALSRRGLEALHDHLNPDNHNGAVFLGLNGLVLKSHGSAAPNGFATAIAMAVDMARDDLMTRIAQNLKDFQRQEAAMNLAASAE